MFSFLSVFDEGRSQLVIAGGAFAFSSVKLDMSSLFLKFVLNFREISVKKIQVAPTFLTCLNAVAVGDERDSNFFFI